MGNSNFNDAKTAKNDEFYTRFSDVEQEMNAYVEWNKDVFRDKTVLLPCDDPEWSGFTEYFRTNFKKLGLKSLISTCYAKGLGGKTASEIEQSSPLFIENGGPRGKMQIIRRMDDGSAGKPEFHYLQGDGSFKSKEVTNLRDKSDIVITNPPFSLFRDFVDWIFEGGKEFIILGNKNAITYKNLFSKLKDNKMWLGFKPMSQQVYFGVPGDIKKITKHQEIYDMPSSTAPVCWFTNIDHFRRHQNVILDSIDNNLKHNKKLKKKLLDDYGIEEYPKYDNYDAIEVPFVDAIPNDYPGIMGVPITYLDKHNPEKFEILGITLGNTVEYDMTCIYKNAIQHNKDGSTQPGSKVNTGATIKLMDEPKDAIYYTADNTNGYLVKVYARILIRNRHPEPQNMPKKLDAESTCIDEDEDEGFRPGM